MLKNYLTIAIRNLWKNKVYSAVNITGMAIGLACCLTIGLFILEELSYDRFHSHGKHIYRVVEKNVQAGKVYDVAVTPSPLASSLRRDFAGIEQTCRIGDRSGFFQYGNTTVESRNVLVVDHSFFSLFDFRLVKGDVRKVLLGPDEVVITESLADGMFGTAWRTSGNLLGRPIQFNDKRTLTLTGIAKDPPTNSHIQFNALLSFSYDELKPERNRWDNNDYHTYIQLGKDADVAGISEQLYKYLNRFMPESKDALSLQPLYDIYLHSDFAFQTDWSKTSNIVYINIFSVVGLIVLLIAIFNFINLSTARAIQRAREVGVRKAIGAFRIQLIVQFIGESLVMTLLAVCMAQALLTVFLPLMNHIADKQISIPVYNWMYWLAIAVFTLLVSVLAGIYPAFYLSGFKPDKVLKGVFNVQGGRLFRRTLVTGQFIFSIVLIIGAIVIYKQLAFLQEKDLGFDQSQLLVVNMKNELRKNPALLKADLQKQHSIAHVSGSSNNLVDVVNSTYAIQWEGQLPDDKFLMTQANIDPDYLNTTGMRLIAGRNFDTRFTSDTSSAYLINETAAKRMGWTPEQALGKSVTLWDKPGKVIGVVKDFHFRPLTATIEPFLFRYCPRESYSNLLVKTNPGQLHKAISAIEQLYRKYEKQTVPEYQFVDQILNNQYRAQQRTGSVVLYFSILAILVSCLGLFGLAAFTATQRVKEIGIRKIVGASVSQIVLLLSKDFLKLVVLAIVIASPLAWYFTNRWLEDFAYRITISWWVFALAGSAVICITIVTVSLQSVRAALMNPVKSLRTE
ncbi:ABC transporter permease [Chitinophaga filiformis]|uniref:Duplicated orphan permease n=1 Tax=Chitinophaga filiformis TaxID=104663 RepID=A0A1G7Y703_CHIFI|nr:ABC transporter permease [Chitinophaga filiformis]SDG91750.1 duplicated orphan permease [Chitinophaga filiformis]